MLKEFKKFISKGNVVDLAVGVVIGGAFGKIVSSLVDDIIIPLVGILIGGIDFSGLTLKIGEAKISYGLFIQNIVDFLIVAFCIFMVIKAFNKITHKEETKKKPEKVRSDEVIILEEIKDLMMKEYKSSNKTTKKQSK